MPTNTTSCLLLLAALVLLVHGNPTQASTTIPSNITSQYRGMWQQSSGKFYDSLADTGTYSLHLKMAETIMREYQFVDGAAYVREGIYVHNKQWQFSVFGVYALSSGEFHFLMIPPSLVITANYKVEFNDTRAKLAFDIGIKTRVIKLMTQTMEGKRIRDDPLNKCIYLGQMRFHTQVVPKSDYPEDTYFDRFDDTRKISKLGVNGQIRSITCNSVMSVQSETYIMETLYSRAVNYASMIVLCAFLEALVLVYQMTYTKTQTSAARVSLLSIGQQAMLDSYLCLMHLTVGIFLDGVFRAFATVAFLKFVLFSIFEMRYLIHIWKARRPQEFANGWNSVRRELQTLYMRFYGGLFFGLVVMYQFNMYFQYFLFILYAFWWPQIYCNATRDAPKSTTPLYIIVVSICRLAVPLCMSFTIFDNILDLYGCPHNIVGLETNPVVCILLVIWVFIQAAILVTQYVLGPRWFVPKFMLPPKYDYKRPIPPETLEDGACNCVICMSEIDAEEALVTPCNHVFHAQCLCRWLQEKLECPTCRFSPLPEL